MLSNEKKSRTRCEPEYAHRQKNHCEVKRLIFRTGVNICERKEVLSNAVQHESRNTGEDNRNAHHERMRQVHGGDASAHGDGNEHGKAAYERS